MFRTLFEYLLWPLILTAALIPTGIGISSGHGPLAFNITYFSLAALLYVLERVYPHEKAWLHSDGQEFPDLAHTAFTKSFVQLLIISATWLGLAAVVGGDLGTGYCAESLAHVLPGLAGFGDRGVWPVLGAPHRP